MFAQSLLESGAVSSLMSGFDRVVEALDTWIGNTDGTHLVIWGVALCLALMFVIWRT